MDNTTPRAQILGNLIRDARVHVGRTVEDCAEALGLSVADYEKAEAGEHPVSLPDLEVLALYLRVPMGYFWGNESLPERPYIDYQSMAHLRHRMIGVMLRQQRLKERRSLQDVAEHLNVSVEQVEAYESGATPVPYLDLETCSDFLNVPITHFLDAEHGPLSRHESEMRLLRQFSSLDSEIQMFIANPQSSVYLETAHKLSRMDVKQLRQIAESILEITW